MLIHSLKPASLLSFGTEVEPIALEPLNVVIGPNGSGKSNLIEAVGLLQAAPRELAAPVSEGGGVRAWLFQGTKLRYLCLLTLLCHPKPPPLLAIEEPELGLHPDVLPSLARLLVDASERTQLIVTTHSDILVDALTETPEVVLVCEKQGESTVMRRLDREELDEWLDKYSLGELWTRGDLGGTRW